jgi:hypothetical protein
MEGIYPDDASELAEPTLPAFGEVVGTQLAHTTDVVDGHDPERHTIDEYGDRPTLTLPS